MASAAPRRSPPATSADAPAPEPQRGIEGAPDRGPRNTMRDAENPDLLAAPRTDHGTLPNMRFSFSDAHNRLEDGGWAREVTARELPVATEIAGVNMRLKAGGVRELHWHRQAEWAYMINGNARITAVDEDGRTFVDDVTEGDLWYFPGGIPHSVWHCAHYGLHHLSHLDRECGLSRQTQKRPCAPDQRSSTAIRQRTDASATPASRQARFPPAPRQSFDFRAGDVGYVEKSNGHWIENTGDTTVRYLELFASDRYTDVSADQWLAFTPPELVRAHLKLPDAAMAALRKTKQPITG